MKLIGAHFNKNGCYFVGQDETGLHGTFCWSMIQTFDLTKAWSVPFKLNMDIANAVVHAKIPETDSKPIATIDGHAAHILTNPFHCFEMMAVDLLNKKLEIEPSTVCFGLKRNDGNPVDAVLLFYTDEIGNGNMMHIRSKEQGRTFFRQPWISEDSRIQTIDHMRPLPYSDPSGPEPMIVTGELIRQLIAARILFERKILLKEVN